MTQMHALRDDDAHRLQCPVGHSSWKPVDGHFWCPYCERHWDGRDGDFQKVRDAKTGEKLDREAVRELERALREGRA